MTKSSKNLVTKTLLPIKIEPPDPLDPYQDPDFVIEWEKVFGEFFAYAIKKEEDKHIK